MVNATLCTTNNEAPWAANVNFDAAGAVWSVKLNTNFEHYKNLLINKRVVIVYKRPELELILKGHAELAEVDDQLCLVRVSVDWLRVVEQNEVRDLDSLDEIRATVVQKLETASPN
jgi:hypothetical protein